MVLFFAGAMKIYNFLSVNATCGELSHIYTTPETRLRKLSSFQMPPRTISTTDQVHTPKRSSRSVKRPQLFQSRAQKAGFGLFHRFRDICRVCKFADFEPKSCIRFWNSRAYHQRRFSGFCRFRGVEVEFWNLLLIPQEQIGAADKSPQSVSVQAESKLF